ncbi:MAG TPA: hypothetical protein VFL34_12350 [Candidatus Sulfotelmatobacter sp.]|nr:hypothetical protein [Candidatus Sulfotelmatobacter sp.]
MIGKLFLVRFLSILPLGLSLLACTQQDAAPQPAPEVLLQAIPAANSAQFERIRDMRAWRNPYLIIQPGGVALLDVADSAEIKLKPAELLPALAALPASNWPYGRVVAATENSVRASEQDSIAIRRNKGIVGGILEGAHIAIKWVPST